MKHALNITTTLILCGSMAQAYAQSPAACIPTPSCTSLGYTSTTSCTGGLKCPFGNYWNCTHINKITELTNKITELEKTIETSQSQGEICIIGSILYSDKSCYLNPQKGKTPIGVVVYVDGNGGGQALALNSIGSYIWGPTNNYIQGIGSFSFTSYAAQDYESCTNSKIIMAAGDKSTYPAVWAAHEYKTEGTSAGDWCLPAAGIFNLYYKIKKAINTGFSRANGTQFTADTRAWSSSEYNNNRAWYSYFNYSYGLDYSSKDNYAEVRPVIEF